MLGYGPQPLLSAGMDPLWAERTPGVRRGWPGGRWDRGHRDPAALTGGRAARRRGGPASRPARALPAGLPAGRRAEAGLAAAAGGAHAHTSLHVIKWLEICF